MTGPSSLSVQVMAHPRREPLVRELLRQLRSDWPAIGVTWDRANDRWDTGRRSLLSYTPSCRWHLVIQDDAQPCDDFARQVTEALAQAPEGPVAFYTGKTGRWGVGSSSEAVRRALALGFSWVEAPGPLWGPAVAIPTRMIPDMVEWCDRETELENYDLRMARYFSSKGIPCRYSVPSLVEHRTGPAHPSLVGHRGSSPGRTAVVWSWRGPNRPWNRLAYRPPAGRPTVSVAVMAHPSRLHYVGPLLEQLDHPELVMDRGEGVWSTAVEAWQSHDPSAAFHLVLQDDALLCPGFRGLLPQVLTDPAVCYSLYLGGNVNHVVHEARHAVRGRRPWVELERLYWGVAVALPTALIRPMLRWAVRWKDAPDGWAGKRSDTRVSRWCMAHGIPVRYPLPSPVNHRVGPSLLGPYVDTPEQRVAWWWAGKPCPVEL